MFYPVLTVQFSQKVGLFLAKNLCDCLNPGPVNMSLGISLVSLHCTTLYYTALHCITLHCTAMYYTAILCTALRCTALHCTALNCSALISTTVHCDKLH